MNALKYIALAVATTLFIACEPDAPIVPTPDEPKPEQPTPDEPKPDDPEPEEPTIEESFVDINNHKTVLHSLLYTTNPTENDTQYIFAMSPMEALTTYDEIIDSGQYIFVSIDKGTLYQSIGNNTEIDLMTLDAENELYMFIVELSKTKFTDYAYKHALSEGSISFKEDHPTGDILLWANVSTKRGEKIVIEARLPYLAPPAPEIEGYLSYVWGGETYADYMPDAAFVESEAGTVHYALCYDKCKTFNYVEDVQHIRFSIAGKAIGEDFDIDIAESEEEFELSFYNPYTEHRYTLSTDNREGATGRFTLSAGVASLTLAIEGEELQMLETQFGIKELRAINECTKIVYDEYSLLFTPASVVLDNSDEETFRIYVSSKAGITTVEDMADAEFKVEYPAEGWEKWLLTGNFISGSNYPTMKILLDGVEHTKGVGTTYGMNAQFKAIDLTAGTITLNTNLYTEEGGVALYYKGEMTVVE